MGLIISSSNKQILTSKNKKIGAITESINNECKYCLGLAEATVKERYDNHKSLIKNESSKNSTELSKYLYSLRENKKISSIKWKIVKIVYINATLFFCNYV